MNSSQRWKNILWVGVGVIVLFVLLSVIGSCQRFQTSKPTQTDGITSVKVTPDGWSEPVSVANQPRFSIDANPETEMVIRVMRWNGTTDEKIDNGPGTYTDLGGGVKTLRFKSKIPTTVFVTFK